MDNEINEQTEAFLKELEVAYFDRGESNFQYLYEKYPKVRIGCRRALFHLTKKRVKDTRFNKQD
jgi:hypothetical protein